MHYTLVDTYVIDQYLKHRAGKLHTSISEIIRLLVENDPGFTEYVAKITAGSIKNPLSKSAMMRREILMERLILARELAYEERRYATFKAQVNALASGDNVMRRELLQEDMPTFPGETLAEYIIRYDTRLPRIVRDTIFDGPDTVLFPPT